MIILVCAILVFLPLTRVMGAEKGEVVINEIGWMGTVGGGDNDEWIELYNNTESPVSLDNWSIEDESYGSMNQHIRGIKGTIPAKGYFLIENNEDCIKNIPADFIDSSMDLNNKGEKLILRDEKRNVIDVVGRVRKPWYAGSRKKPKYSMERTDPAYSGRDANNWHPNNGVITNGIDKKGKQVNGTPGAANSSVPEIDREQISINILNSMIPPLVIDYSVPQGSVISIRVYSKDSLVKTIINKESSLTDREPAKEGVQGSCVWDEKDAYGELVEPGEYRALLEILVKGAGKKEFIFSEPIEIKYIPVK